MIGIANDFLSDVWGWVVAIVRRAAYAVTQLQTRAVAASSRPGWQAAWR